MFHVLREKSISEEEKITLAEARKNMPPCPICGRKAFISHDIVDGFDMGFMAGCPAFCLDDGIHGISDMDDPKAPRVDGYSAKDVFDKWVGYCERYQSFWIDKESRLSK